MLRCYPWRTSGPASAPRPSSPETMVPGSPARILAPDSRILSGMSYGPPTGRPVLFVAGAATGKTMSFGGNLLDEQNVRLLTMDRPGMGGSTFDSGRTLSSTADDYR